MPKPEKVTSPNNKYNGAFSDSEDENDYNANDLLGDDVIIRVQQNQDKVFRNFKTFLHTPEFITTKGDAKTNIVDRCALLNNSIGAMTYYVPDDKINKFFKFMETCRKNNNKLMLYERQLEYSGIMIDFDIFQKDDTIYVDNGMVQDICNRLFSIIKKYVDLENPVPEYEEDSFKIYMAVIKKPKIVYNDDKKCYKDGFHILIPSVKIKRDLKKLIIQKCIDDDIFKGSFRKVKTPEGYTYRDFLDTNSAHVPCHFLGSSTKTGAPPYILQKVFTFDIFREDMQSGDFNPTAIDDGENLKNPENILCQELSLNWEVEERRHRVIRKRQYEIKENYLIELKRYQKSIDDLEGLNENGNGILSILNIHDPDAEYIEGILDTLSPERYTDFDMWFKVLCALGHTSRSYKPLADKFSQKCLEKYNPAAFDHYWNMACSSSKNNLTIGSIHYWAKLDNPARYEELKGRSIFEMVSKKIYDIQVEGNLQHYDIAQILHKALKYKYSFDPSEGGVWYEFVTEEEPHVKGEIYKWRKIHKLRGPSSLKRYTSEILTILLKKIINKIDGTLEEKKGDEQAQYHYMVKKNLQASSKKLRDAGFKNGIMHECEQIFEKLGFITSLDKDPEVIGVGNGILKLGERIQFIQGFHDYNITMFTAVDYEEFNPYDDITKKLLITLRNLFPDDEPDSYNFMMHYLASSLDGKKKESLLLLLVGNGSNGKSFLVELLKETLSSYAVKMPLSFLTSRAKNSENATPVLMSLINARFAYYSESEKSESLNTAKVKEVTGQETLGGRKNYGDYVNFKPTCHHLVTSNYDFEVNGTDHGIWRRLKKLMMKIKFCKQGVDNYDPTNPYERLADPSIGSTWPDNPQVRTAFLSILSYYYESLQRNYRGLVENVPHPNIMKETENFRNRQDKINSFINSSLVKIVDQDVMTPLTTIIEKYSRWHESLYPEDKEYKKSISLQFENSKISKLITKNRAGSFIKGYRVLGLNEMPEEGESYFIDNSMDSKSSKIDLKSESAEEYYERICREYDAYIKQEHELRKQEFEKSLNKKKAVIELQKQLAPEISKNQKNNNQSNHKTNINDVDNDNKYDEHGYKKSSKTIIQDHKEMASENVDSETSDEESDLD